MTNNDLDPRNHSPEAFRQHLQAIGQSTAGLNRWFSQILSNGCYEPADWSAAGVIPRTLRRHIGPLPKLELQRSQSSPTDRFQKLLFQTKDRMAIETVLIPLHKTNNVSICLSSQVGCVMGCVFCATGRMTKRRNLETWEIVDQFVQAKLLARSQGRRVTGAVFMGMGEPFLNYANVIAAAKLLCYPVTDAIASKAITISTVGLLHEIERYTAEAHPFRLSISLGAATDEKRRQLVPVAAKTPVKEIVQAARRYALHRKTRINISYVCISGENVSEADARELGSLFVDCPVRLDLIDVSDPTGRFQPPSDLELSTFRDALSVYLRQPVVRRYSGGKDIAAGCGMLAGESIQRY